MHGQLTLFDDHVGHLPDVKPVDLVAARSGTFVDNMSLPIHRWFHYSAGFAALWVEEVLAKWDIRPGQIVLDPFAGSGTVPVVCDTLGLNSIGIEAHPVVARICRAKLLWECPAEHVARFAEQVSNCAQDQQSATSSYPELIHRSFDAETLATLDRLKSGHGSRNWRTIFTNLV